MTRDEQLIKAALEIAAAHARAAFDARSTSRKGHHSLLDWTDGYDEATRACAAVIRAITPADVLAGLRTNTDAVARRDKRKNVFFQERVDPWMQACFGAEISADKLERGDRLLEEVLELLQSGDYPSERIAALTKYVWSREIGEPAQEVGGVMVTLAAYCLAHGLNMHTAGETELTRIWTEVDKIRAKQAAKPKGSALPQAWPESNTPTP